jgi:pyruvate/2-oxoglutarate dehydrogenase complex dihydrolipoamide acyltransferase (E2) component
MSLEVTMPQMGESVVEGTVTKWLVKEGDQVNEDQPLCEISTDKVDTEIPSPGSGTIARLLVSEGQTLPVGAALAIIEGGRATASASADRPTPVERSAAASEHVPQAPSAPAPSSVHTRQQPATSGSTQPQQQTPNLAAAPASAPRRYSPVVMRMAEEHGIDLSLVPATGLGGRISKRDIERYIETLRSGQAPPKADGTQPPPAQTAIAPAPAPSAAPPAFRPPLYQPREGDTVEPFSRRRKLIAEHMVYSKTHSPHVGTVAELDLTRLVALREAHKEAFHKREGFTLTLLPFAAMAATRALREFPRMNASVAGDSLIIRREINLGIAMDAEEGLVVPVIKGADTFTVTGLAREIERLRVKLQNRSLSPDDLANGSFTLSNPGREGNLYGFAIINQPQVGILRMGEVKKRPVVIEINGAEALAIRSMMYLALSYDHRVIDGVLGNRFLFRAARILEEADFEL